MKTEYHSIRRCTLVLLAAVTLLLSGCSENGADAVVYNKNCASCHGRDGQGLRALYPPLPESDYLDKRISELPCLISGGIRGTIVTGNKTKNIRMPAFANLTSEEMSTLINYLQHRWGKGGATVSEQTVAQWLRSCP
ncbi:MAG: cytochrome c [Desulfofustis sp.]|nr:cytochrome c [Desulfofustis sp.]RZW26606.1 MAG: cytochrome c [Desulfobulbaceae bacterium]MBT8345761.1 cytochrome c [Desulfofustis sp.]MBT8354725.1 cytochrome c [Desulfofustis sp.]NNF46255.1 cytochrome c [Desulfofustis sp.]